jgi:hypothetical protein
MEPGDAIGNVLYQFAALGHEEDQSEAKQFADNHAEPLNRNIIAAGKWRALIFMMLVMLAGSIACFSRR